MMRLAVTLSSVDVELRGDMLIVTDHRSGEQCTVTAEEFDLWAHSMLGVKNDPVIPDD